MKYLLFLSALAISIQPLLAQNAPINFESGGEGASWTWTVFENDDNPPLNIVTNPDMSGINTSATVAEFTARVTGQPYAGTESMHGADIGAFSLTTETSLIKIMVYKTTISNVGIKLTENNGASLGEILVSNTVTNQWEELSFNFSALQGITYDQIVIFPDFELRTQENVIYFDNIIFEEQDPNNVDGCTDPTAINYNPNANMDDGTCLFSMTFNVDMECEEGMFGQVELTGPFFGWCAGCVVLDDPDGDDVYSVTVNLPAGVFEYKYSRDLFAGQEDLVDDVNAGTGFCAPITDGANYANRTVEVSGGGSTNDTYGTCGICGGGCTDPTAANFDPEATIDDGLCTYPVTFQVDMNDVTDAFTTPEVNGTFNGFCGSCNPLSDENADGIWETTINLLNGYYDFKFSADAFAIEEELTDGTSCTQTTDGFVNRALNVSGPTTYGPVAWNECPPCPADIDEDGQVNVNDFLILNSSFGDLCNGCAADINGDGTVDVDDFLIFNSGFGMPCN